MGAEAEKPHFGRPLALGEEGIVIVHPPGHCGGAHPPDMEAHHVADKDEEGGQGAKDKEEGETEAEA